MQRSGILYIVSGLSALEDCKMSISTVRKNMPEVPIAIIADERLEKKIDINWAQKIFVPMPEKWDWKIKVDNIRNSPFINTLFLDTDTIVCQDVSNLFTLLERFDIALCQDNLRTWGYELPGPPDTFPMMNSGVIAYKKSNHLDELFNTWAKAHEMLDEEKAKRKRISYTDQNSLRYALYFTDNVRIHTLPSEYNCRVSAGYVVGPVKIIHAHSNLHEIDRILNSSTGPRLHGTIAGRMFFVIERRKIRISNPFKKVFKG